MDSFYCLPIAAAFTITFAAVIAFGSAFDLIWLKAPKTARIVSAAALAAYIVFILYLTLFSRSARADREMYLIPFYSFVMAEENVEIYRSMLMNIYLFMPFGAALSCALGKGKAFKITVTALAALVLSSAIECVQCVFMLGCTQTDDVICNVIGSLFGCAALISSAIVKKAGKTIKSKRTMKTTVNNH